jgi:hypothetical protein
MMSVYALISGGTVVSLFTPAFPSLPISQQIHVGLGPIDITTMSPQPQIGWTYTGGTFAAPPAPPAPTLAQQAQTLLGAGLAITSTATPALNATYRTDATTQQNVSAEVTSILLNGTFADGGASVAWQDAGGASHSFSVAQYKTLATAVAAFVAGCLKVVNGQSTTLPAASATIA